MALRQASCRHSTHACRIDRQSGPAHARNVAPDGLVLRETRSSCPQPTSHFDASVCGCFRPGRRTRPVVVELVASAISHRTHAWGFSFGAARMRLDRQRQGDAVPSCARMPALAQLVPPNLQEIDAVDPACDSAMLDGAPSRYT
jgi:hypothetical protein